MSREAFIISRPPTGGSVADSLFTYLLQLKHDDRNCSFCSSMSIRLLIEHDGKAICSRPKAVLQLIEHGNHTVLRSVADLLLIAHEAESPRSVCLTTFLTGPSKTAPHE